MSYDPHETLIAAARPKSELWRTCLGVMFLVIAYFGLLLFITSAIGAFAPGLVRRALFAEPFATTPGGLIVFLTTFFGMLGGVGLVTYIFHQRDLWSLIGPPTFAFRDGLRVVWGTAPIVLVGLVGTSLTVGVTLNTAPVVWALLLPVSLGLLLIQVSAEELVFRGYLQPQLAARMRSPLAWMIVPSALFGLAHLDPVNAGSNAWIIVAWTFAFGLAAADLTARTGTIGAAIALHFMNNLSALLIISLDGSLSGLALFVLPLTLADEAALRSLLFVDIFYLACLYLAARLALRV